MSAAPSSTWTVAKSSSLVAVSFRESSSRYRKYQYGTHMGLLNGRAVTVPSRTCSIIRLLTVTVCNCSLGGLPNFTLSLLYLFTDMFSFPLHLLSLAASIAHCASSSQIYAADIQADPAVSLSQFAVSTTGSAFALPAPEQSLVMAYYPDWMSNSFPPEKINFKRFHIIDFAFAFLDKNLKLAWDDTKIAPALLGRLVKAAHSQGCKVKLSIGGWTGSR